MNNRVLNTVFLFFGLIFIFNKSYSQDWSPEMNPESRSHIGIAIGAMNYSGFMGEHYNSTMGIYTAGNQFTLSQARISGELMYRYDFSDQFHVRADGMIGQLQHCNCSVAAGNAGNVGSFHTEIAEVDVLPEYDLLNMSTNKWHYRYKWSPYIFAGGGFYRLFSYKASGPFVEGSEVQEFAFNMRWGIGVKYAVTPGIQLFLEGSRREFSKQIDFYNNGSQSRYYSIMFGGMFSLQKRHYVNYW